MTITVNNLTIQQVAPNDEQVRQMVAILDRYQLLLYGKQHVNLETPGQLQKNRAYMLGAYDDDKLVGIGAVKLFGHYGEIKRIYVQKKIRGTGAAALILSGLEAYNRIQNKQLVKLETGRLQFAAIRFYENRGYAETGPFGSYQINPMSIYFQKKI